MRIKQKLWGAEPTEWIVPVRATISACVIVRAQDATEARDQAARGMHEDVTIGEWLDWTVTGKPERNE